MQSNEQNHDCSYAIHVLIGDQNSGSGDQIFPISRQLAPEQNG